MWQCCQVKSRWYDAAEEQRSYQKDWKPQVLEQVQKQQPPLPSNNCYTWVITGGFKPARLLRTNERYTCAPLQSTELERYCHCGLRNITSETTLLFLLPSLSDKEEDQQRGHTMVLYSHCDLKQTATVFFVCFFASNKVNHTMWRGSLLEFIRVLHQELLSCSPPHQVTLSLSKKLLSVDDFPGRYRPKVSENVQEQRSAQTKASLVGFFSLSQCVHVPLYC